MLVGMLDKACHPHPICMCVPARCTSGARWRHTCHGNGHAQSSENVPCFCELLEIKLRICLCTSVYLLVHCSGSIYCIQCYKRRRGADAQAGSARIEVLAFNRPQFLEYRASEFVANEYQAILNLAAGSDPDDVDEDLASMQHKLDENILEDDDVGAPDKCDPFLICFEHMTYPIFLVRDGA